MLGALAAVAVTLGLLVLTLQLLRRVQRGGAGGAVPMAVLQRLATGPRHGIALLQCGSRVLVVAQDEGRTTLLTELTGDDLARALAAPASPAAPGRLAAPPVPFAPTLARWLGALLVVVLPVALHAQPRPQAEARQPPAPRPATAPAPAAPGGRQAPAPGGATLKKVYDHTPTNPKPLDDRVKAKVNVELARPTVPRPSPPSIDFTVGDARDGLHLTGTVGLVIFMGAMTLLPAVFLLMTSFTRILIVLHFLRSAIGTQSTPPNQLIVAIAVLLSTMVMQPVLQEANTTALQPYLEGRLTQTEAYTAGLLPFRRFMLANTRDQDVATFAELTHVRDARSLDDLPTVTVMSAFITGELRTAFQMGFVIFLPFLVVDLVIASVLMSMGMMMLPPVLISLPFKLLLFVLADGWTLVVKNLVGSFRV